VDRLAEDGDTTIAKVMAAVQSSGTHEVQFHDGQGKDQRAVLSIWHATMTVRPPIGKQKQYRHQELQIIYAEEISPPQCRAPVFWKLITNLPVETHTDAVHKHDWYALRWNIEIFFKTIKTRCRIEELGLTTADCLATASHCVALWPGTCRGSRYLRPHRLLPSSRISSRLLERSMPDGKRDHPRNLDFYITAVARLGGYLDPPPTRRRELR
jgi:hypothetical protein